MRVIHEYRLVIESGDDGERYDTAKRIAKKHGGAYAPSVRRPRGGVNFPPGWLFADEATAEACLAEIQRELP